MRRSIRKQLIIWLLGMLGMIYGARVWWGYYQAIDIANSNYDELLLNSADSVAARMEENNAGVFYVHLAPDTLSILSHNNEDSFYYEVFDTGGKRIAGNTDLLGSTLDLSSVDANNFKTITLNNEPVRVIQTRLPVPEVELKSVIVIAAETQHVRTHLTNHIIASIALAQLLVIIATVVVVVMAINAVLSPLSLLRQSILKRSVNDLSHVDNATVSEEVLPLVNAINSLLDRSRDEIELHNRFVANAAHQLRTPIAGLKTYSSMIGGLTTIDDFRHVMNKLDSGLDRLTHLVNQLLALARVEHATLAPVDLKPIVSEIASELDNLALAKEIDIEFLHCADSIMVNGDTNGLRHLISNLLENAIHYTEPKGKITVGIKSIGNGVTLTVEDNGPGIPIDEREHVYERFYRLAGSNGNGCGLGLSIVKEVVLAHKATIAIDAPPVGHGTLVSVVFPKP